MNMLKKTSIIILLFLVLLTTLNNAWAQDAQTAEQSIKSALLSFPNSDAISIVDIGRVSKVFLGTTLPESLWLDARMLGEQDRKNPSALNFMLMGFRYHTKADGTVENNVLMLMKSNSGADKAVASLREKFQKRDHEEKYGTRVIYIVGAADAARALGQKQIASVTTDFAVTALDSDTIAFGTASYLKAGIDAREGRGGCLDPALVNALTRNNPLMSVGGKFSTNPAADIGLAGTKYGSLINADLSTATSYSASLVVSQTTFELSASIWTTAPEQADKIAASMNALAKQLSNDLTDPTIRDILGSLNVKTEGNEIVLHAEIAKTKVEARLRELFGIKDGPEEKARRESISAMLLTMKGHELNSQQAVELEKQLEGKPQELSTRTLLLGYYFGKNDVPSRLARQKHILWIIENHPEASIAGSPEGQLTFDPDEEVYAKARALWLKQVVAHSQNTAVLSNAADFFNGRERIMAESLIKQAATIEPENYQWFQRLGRLHERAWRWSSGEESRNSAWKAFVYYEQAWRATRRDQDRAYLLPEVTKFAYEAGNLNKAAAYATTLLNKYARSKQSPNYGDAIHYGNLVLGRVALARGNIVRAKAYLLESGKTPGSPHLDSFGPSMILAKELLEKGERRAVIQYFHLCAQFWKDDEGQLKKWEDIVRRGGMPDFDSTLYN
jgi:hypothetical protein